MVAGFSAGLKACLMNNAVVSKPGPINFMRLLFISLTVPLPANNGLKIRTWAMLRALAAEGHETTLLMFADADED